MHPDPQPSRVPSDGATAGDGAAQSPPSPARERPKLSLFDVPEAKKENP